MKSLGVERIISLSAVGSLKEEHKPLDFVIPDLFWAELGNVPCKAVRQGRSTAADAEESLAAYLPVKWLGALQI